MSARFVIEGIWSGYVSSQSRVVHREVTRDASRAEWARKAGCIIYTDGTRLFLDVRDAKPRERVREVRGYSDLIDDCVFYGVNTVAALTKARATPARGQP